MSVKKVIKNELGNNFESLFNGLNRLANDINFSLDDFAKKLEAIRNPTRYKRLVALRNWITHFLLWCILVLLLSSCFVAARTAYIETPRVKAGADTITAAIGKTYKDVINPKSY